jgi:hypothetical protein
VLFYFNNDVKKCKKVALRNKTRVSSSYNIIILTVYERP